jgi:diguanylate cyclase (GGDEF)-like protein/PAS domain S-box-containing protein
MSNDLTNKLRYLEKLLDTMSAPISYQSPERKFVWVNQAYADMCGQGRDQLQGQPVSKFVRMEAFLQGTPHFHDALEGKASKMELYQPNRTSSKLEGRWFELSWVPDVIDNEVKGVFAIYKDIHEARIAYDSLIKAAQIDALTGLLNRRSFMAELTKRCALTTTETVVLYMDLDGFKTINDSHGHAVGDIVLQSAAARIKDALRGSDMAARIGGDEFVVCFSSAQPRSAAQLLCERIISVMAAPMEIDDHMLQITASIGVAFTPAHGSTPDGLLRKADEAMYIAKRDGKARFAFATMG